MQWTLNEAHYVPGPGRSTKPSSGEGPGPHGAHTLMVGADSKKKDVHQTISDCDKLSEENTQGDVSEIKWAEVPVGGFYGVSEALL